MVAVSSMAHHMGQGLDLDNLHYRKGRKYSAWHAYGEGPPHNPCPPSGMQAYSGGAIILLTSKKSEGKTGQQKHATL